MSWTSDRNSSWKCLASTLVLLLTCVLTGPPTVAEENASSQYPHTVEGARAFLAAAEARLKELSIAAERASWVYSTHITHDTELLSAKASEDLIAATVELAKEAARFSDLDLDADTRRQLEFIKLSLPLPAPSDPAKRQELTRITTAMQGTYSKGRYCPEGEGKNCLTLRDMELRMAESRNAEELLELWRGWRQVSPPMRDEFARYVELANEGARELGFVDLGAMWRSGYDMEPDAFAAELDRLWNQVRPLYEALHCHVRARLAETYGSDAVSAEGPLPAHLLGNMWAQSWGNVYELVAPASSDPGYDLTQRLQAAGVDEREMVRYGERFFSSLGEAPLPETFWERSQFTAPQDREVVCHASAWDVDWQDDLRIKMCIQITGEEFSVIHHELGHNYYQRAYNELPFLYQNSANDGFHEALGDTIALSVTPAYLVEIGLLDAEPDASADIGLLLRMALDKVAFLPFGLLIDQYRWKVFAGEITPADYNAGWWQLRGKYQGVAPPAPRGEEFFDPGAKYHIPANVPYTRYFLAHILQFQLHRGLCRIAGDDGPLHRCSIYGSQEAGERLHQMMAMGRAQPWPQALKLVTGQEEMDATAILDYFAPLQKWLDEQNAGRSCGWGG